MNDGYPKLVRDKIPEIVKAKEGVDPSIRIIENDDEYLEALLQKLVEEAIETRGSKGEGNLDEELADVLEVIYAILALEHKTIENIIAIKKEKREKRGGFEKRILMLADPRKR